MAFDVNPNCVNVCLESIDEFRLLTNDMQLSCAKYGLQTCLTPTEGSRVLALDIEPPSDK
jgi:hypothetical protein